MDSFLLGLLIFGGLACILVVAFAWALCAAGSSREEDQLDAIAEMLEGKGMQYQQPGFTLPVQMSQEDWDRATMSREEFAKK